VKVTNIDIMIYTLLFPLLLPSFISFYRLFARSRSNTRQP